MPTLSNLAPSILAIAPGARYLGFAAFSGGELVRFGVRSFPGKKTRPALAAAMVGRYWFLYSYLKPGRTQHYWRQMFDAVALGTLACQEHLRTSKARSS